jgi:benzodiazapine receptor
MAEATARPSLWKTALLCVIPIELLGGASGWLSNSGFGNSWFDRLYKPSFMPPGWAFGVVWPILYAMIGVALAVVLNEPSSDRRRLGLTLFVTQLVLNFLWSPIFFAAHDISLAKWVIFIIAVLAAVAAGQFLRIRKAAGLLMIPYLAWLVFAATLNATLGALNPGSGTSLLGL